MATGMRAFGADWSPDRVASAPGRLELLGNHIDYNGGPVLAAAIDRRVEVLGEDRLAGDGTIEAVFADVQDAVSIVHDTATLAEWRNASPPTDPHDYLRGAIAAVLNRPGIELRTRIRLAIAGDVPIGFGLSSSAALCVGLVLAIAEPSVEPKSLVLLAQEAEHRAGTPCGAMDQSASVAGGVILFDSATLDVRRLRPVLGNFTFAVADSGVERSLGASSYPIRVQESNDMLEIARHRIRPAMPYLSDLHPDELAKLERPSNEMIPDHLLRRARHVVSETQRVREGLAAVEASDWPRFGGLMNASGRSSATDYEISHPRVEELVAETRSVDGVVGARMMGGGEGGTALILLDQGSVGELDSRLRAGYFARYGMYERPDLIHVFGFAPGAAVRPS